MSRSKWKSPVSSPAECKEQKRNVEITPNLVGQLYRVHNGKNLAKISVLKDMIGYKFGEFVPTRAKYVYRKKKKKKKKK